MLDAGNVRFDELLVQKYIADLEIYWNDIKPVFKLDPVCFLYLFGILIVGITKINSPRDSIINK